LISGQGEQHGKDNRRWRDRHGLDGQVHSRAYNVIKDRFYDEGLIPRLVVCSDNVEARAKECAERFGFERYTTNWQEVVDDPAVEIINVATPTDCTTRSTAPSPKRAKRSTARSRSDETRTRRLAATTPSRTRAW